MDVGEILQIANNLVQLDIDVAQNQLAIAMKQRRRACRRRRWWMQPWLQRRTLHGQYERLMSELEVEDPAVFKNFVRVESAMFRELLNKLLPANSKNDTFYMKALLPGLQLAINLRCLATGDSYHSLMYGFWVAHNTISCIVCESVLSHHQGISTGSDCLSHHAPGRDTIADLFCQKLQFHHALRALDGKNVAI